MKLVLAIAMVLCLHGATFAQTSPKRLEFAVASVKPAAAATLQSTKEQKTPDAGSVSLAAGKASYQGVTLKRLLMAAYDLTPSQISGPAWIDTERYDVVATFPDGTTKEAISLMLQKLLADRFQISQHTEKKDEPVYILAIGQTGLKLKPSSSDRPQSAGSSINMAGEAKMQYMGNTMADFASNLSNQLGRTVTDQTGLAGKFDIILPVDAKDLQPGASSLSSSLLGAVKTVGLKLEPGKTPMKHLVIDTAQKIPTEN